ncbi:hypothetical protein ACJROX_17120 [Pseudalkalibacillus sp. A8]|uniref:hypothetical protein n=1 Tax=Pseudalkalibacillus sp. A8 TaxID=3382641 RepID=UPI0038B607D7
MEYLAVICEANWRISQEATEEEMGNFYSGVSYKTLDLIKEGLLTNFRALQKNYMKLSERTHTYRKLLRTWVSLTQDMSGC